MMISCVVICVCSLGRWIVTESSEACHTSQCVCVCPVCTAHSADVLVVGWGVINW